MNDNIQNYDYYKGTYKPSLFRHLCVKYMFNITYHILYNIYVFLYGKKYADGIALRTIFKCLKKLQKNDIMLIRQPFLSIIQPPSDEIDIKNISHTNSFSVLVNLNKFSNSNTCVFYIHGGGYVSGDISGFLGMAEKVSIVCECPVFLSQYRLAPEVSIETSVNDLYEAFHSIGTNFSNVIIMGDSAGGGLGVLLLNELINCSIDNIKRVKAFILFSPMLNLECNSNSYLDSDDPMCSLDIVKYCSKLALNGEPLSETNNPIIASVNNFPPTFITLADDELFYDDAITFINKLNEKQVMNELHIYKHTVHSAPILWKYVNSSSHIFDNILKFIQKYIS